MDKGMNYLCTGSFLYTCCYLTIGKCDKNVMWPCKKSVVLSYFVLENRLSCFSWKITYTDGLMFAVYISLHVENVNWVTYCGWMH